MNTNKFYEFFQPELIKEQIHIIGCGAIGSTLAENLVRMGLENITLYDFDTVSEHNIANQMFLHDQIGMLKTVAVEANLLAINPQLKIKTYDKGYSTQPLSGYVFLCVDNIDLRREIVTENLYNDKIIAMFDFRMRLTDAQAYMANWSQEKDKNALLASMNFTHEEAVANTPVTACGTTLNVVYIVRIIVSLGVANFINFVKDCKNYSRLIVANCATMVIDVL